MITFLLLLIPFALALYCMWVKDKRDIIPAFCGFISAVLLCAIKLIFTFPHRVIPFSFAENVTFYLVKLSLLPPVVLFLVFFFIVKDTVLYKVSAFFPLVASFYMVYLPYSIISYSGAIYSAYELFAKPLVYLAMISGLAIAVKCIYNSIISKKYLFTVVAVVFTSVYLVVPAITDALYAIGYKLGLLIVYDCLYMILPFGWIGFSFIKGIVSKAKASEE